VVGAPTEKALLDDPIGAIERRAGARSIWQWQEPQGGQAFETLGAATITPMSPPGPQWIGAIPSVTTNYSPANYTNVAAANLVTNK